jgi:hypothetical protein
MTPRHSMAADSHEQRHQNMHSRYGFRWKTSAL